MGKFQVIDDLEIFLLDADDLWFRCPSCAVAAFFLWVQRVAMVDILVPPVVMGASLVISLCCVLCRGNSCRVSGAGMIVAMFRGFSTLFLALLGSPEGSSIEMYCVLAWFGMLARGFLVASDGPIYSDPGSACLGLLANVVLCLFAQDPVAQFLIRRCALHSLCPCFDLSCSCLRVLNLPWSFQRVVSMFHSSLSGCERNTRAHVNVSLIFPY